MFGSLVWGSRLLGGLVFGDSRGKVPFLGHERLHEIGAQCRP